jgi:hypothetical protein
MRIGVNGKSDRPALPASEQLKREIQRRKPRTIEEANKIADEVRERYNRTPQVELGGVSPEEAYALTRPDWIDTALTLNDELSLEDLSEAKIFQNARRTLLVIQELGAAKATASGAFNRKFATRMFEEFVMSDNTRKSILHVNKVLNQDDVPFLTLFRHLLTKAGLLLFSKGEFRLTKKGGALLAESAAGELCVLLFRTLLLQINLGAMDGLPEAMQVQRCIGFSMYQISRKADNWISFDDLVPILFLPAIRDSLPPSTWSPDPAPSYAELRVLRPLKDFGLLEIEKKDRWGSPSRVRKTRLFDKLIQFNLPPSLE